MACTLLRTWYISGTFFQWILCILFDGISLGSHPIPLRTSYFCLVFSSLRILYPILYLSNEPQRSQNLINHQGYIFDEFCASCLMEFPLDPAQFHSDVLIFDLFSHLWANCFLPLHLSNGPQRFQNLIDHQEYVLNKFCTSCLMEFPLNPTQFHWDVPSFRWFSNF